MMIRLLALLLLFVAVPGWAAPTIAGTPTTCQGHATSVTCAHTVASGTNRVTYIAIQAANDVDITSISFAGGTPTLLGSYAGAIWVYRLVNPTAGATSVSAPLTDDTYWSVHIITLSGVDQTTPDDGMAGENTSVETAGVSTTAVTSAVGDLVLAFALIAYPDIAAADGGTLVTKQESVDGGVVSTALVYEAGAASVVTGASSSTPSYGDNIIMAWNVNAASGGGTGNTGIILKRRKH